MSEQLKINKLSEALGVGLTINGLKIAKTAFQTIPRLSVNFSAIKDAFLEAGLGTSITQLDTTYFCAKWEDWQRMINPIRDISKAFPWTANIHDCDNRSHFSSSLTGVLLGLNSMGQVYCEITNIKTGNKSWHWANIIVDSDKRVFLFDMDNGGNTMEILKGQPITMGNWSYRFESARFF